jgi:hypothetical protein
MPYQARHEAAWDVTPHHLALPAGSHKNKEKKIRMGTMASK